MKISITLPDGRSMREALAQIVDAAREERDWCDEHGRSTRAECLERIAVAIEKSLWDNPTSGLWDEEDGK
jgi:hypothetical protein